MKQDFLYSIGAGGVAGIVNVIMHGYSTNTWWAGATGFSVCFLVYCIYRRLR